MYTHICTITLSHANYEKFIQYYYDQNENKKQKFSEWLSDTDYDLVVAKGEYKFIRHKFTSVVYNKNYKIDNNCNFLNLKILIEFLNSGLIPDKHYSYEVKSFFSIDEISTLESLVQEAANYKLCTK